MTLQNTIEHKYYSTIMLLFVFAYALLNIEFHRLGNIFLGLLLIGSLPIFIVQKDKIFKDPIIIILALVLLVQVASWINSLIYLPQYANEIPKLDRLSKLFVFFFIAYWLKGNIKNIMLLWLFFILGFLFAITVNVDIQTILELGLNERVTFSIKNSQFDSMLAGTSLLMTLSLFYLTIKSSQFSNKLKILFLLGLFLLSLLFMYFVLITQSRQVWLGLISVIIIGSIAYFKTHKTTNLKFPIVGFLMIVGVLYLLSTSSIIQKRISAEQDSMVSLLDNSKPIDMSSVGIRVNSWLEAMDWIKRHPFIGLDSEAIPEVIHQSSRFNNTFKKHFGHLHNFFIETLVAYGIVGLILILTMYYYVIKSTQTTSIEEDKRKYYLLASICFTTYWLVINNFETFNSRHLGIFAHNIIFASFYTFHLTNYLKPTKKV